MQSRQYTSSNTQTNLMQLQHNWQLTIKMEISSKHWIIVSQFYELRHERDNSMFTARNSTAIAVCEVILRQWYHTSNTCHKLIFYFRLIAVFSTPNVRWYYIASLIFSISCITRLSQSQTMQLIRLWLQCLFPAHIICSEVQKITKQEVEKQQVTKNVDMRNVHRIMIPQTTLNF